MGTLPIPQGASIGEAPQAVEIPHGATIGAQGSENKLGILKRIWSAVNTPVADFVLPEGVKTADLVKAALFEKAGMGSYIPGINDEHTVAQAHLGDSPTKAAIKAFVGGSIGDTGETAAGFTSPLSLGTMAAGAATKFPGAVGTAAKAVTGAASVGFAGKGGADVVKNAPAALQGDPDAAQRALQGGAMVAGGAAGATEAGAAAKAATKKALLLGRTPEEAYQSALKPSTTLSEAERTRIVGTGLQEGVPVTPQGLEKLGELIGKVNDQIKQTIAADPTRSINPGAAAQNISKTRVRFQTQVNPAADLQAIDSAKQEFLDQFRSTPGGAVRNLTAEEAQSMKQGTYRALGDKAYGELKGASIEAQKALARGLKDELAAQFPELKDLNARDSQLLDLQPVLERAVNRIGNHQLVGIGTPVVTGAAKALTGSSKLAAVAGIMKAVLDNPAVKSRLAIAISKGGNLPPAQVAQRLGAYGASLASAVESASAQRESSDNPAPSPNQ